MSTSRRQRQEKNMVIDLLNRIRADIIALEKAVLHGSYDLNARRVQSAVDYALRLQRNFAKHKNSPYSIDDFIRREN